MMRMRKAALGTILLGIACVAGAAEITPAEAKAYWDSLSEAQQAAIIAKAKNEAQQAKAAWDALTPEEQAAVKAAAQEKAAQARAARTASQPATSSSGRFGGGFGGFGR